MILSKRERYIAVLAIGAGAVFLLYQYLFNPLWQRRTQAESTSIIENGRLWNVQKTNRDNRGTEDRWREMNQAGLKLDPTSASATLQKEALNWARNARMAVSYRGDSRPQTEKHFHKITAHVSAQSTNMAAIRDFLFQVELSPMPVRVVDLQIRPKREGSEELTMELAISTLCAIPEKQEKNTRLGGTPREVRP